MDPMNYRPGATCARAFARHHTSCLKPAWEKT